MSKNNHAGKSPLPRGKLRTDCTKRAEIGFSVSVVRRESVFEICLAKLQISVLWLMNEIIFYFLNVLRIHPVVFPQSWGLELPGSTSGYRQGALWVVLSLYSLSGRQRGELQKLLLSKRAFQFRKTAVTLSRLPFWRERLWRYH